MHKMHEITTLLESRAMELKHSPREVDQKRVIQIGAAISVLEELPTTEYSIAESNKDLVADVKLDFPLGILRQKLAALSSSPELDEKRIGKFRRAISLLEKTEPDEEIMYMIPDEAKIVSGHRDSEYKHYASCEKCELHKNNVSSGTGACYECDHKEHTIRHIDHVAKDDQVPKPAKELPEPEEKLPTHEFEVPESKTKKKGSKK